MDPLTLTICSLLRSPQLLIVLFSVFLAVEWGIPLKLNVLLVTSNYLLMKDSSFIQLLNSMESPIY